LIKLINQSIKNDLQSRYVTFFYNIINSTIDYLYCVFNTYILFVIRNSIHVNLAMQCIANIGSRDMAEAFGYDIPKLLVSGYVYFVYF